MEKRAFRLPGFLALLLVIVLAAVAVVLGLALPGPATAAVASVLGVMVVLGVTGFVVVNPNDAQVVQFFGRYVGSIREAGFHWTWPLTGRRRITLRVRNFE
ncbi:MAG TPA: SPFH domain-containing protein, partial [Asanoa sp.]|nr:SPFH domain-containing protein [Asanoa sp.]